MDVSRPGVRMITRSVNAKIGYRIYAFIDAMVAMALGGVGANRPRGPIDPRMRFTPRSRGGSTSSHTIPRILRTARKKFERHNRHFAQRRLRACA